MDRRDSKADGVLNGPTTESWFDHWYRHLIALGVRFVRAAVDRLEPPPPTGSRAPHLRPRVEVVLADGTRLDPDYVVAAVDAWPQPSGSPGCCGRRARVAPRPRLDGFATSVPPPDGPLQPARTDRRPAGTRTPWPRWGGCRGTGSRRWPASSSTSTRSSSWSAGTSTTRVPSGGSRRSTSTACGSGGRHWPATGFVSVLSVDIGDFNTPSEHLLDEHGRGKAARDCTADELAAEVWRQIVEAITSDIANVPEALVPLAGVVRDRPQPGHAAGPGGGEARPCGTRRRTWCRSWATGRTGPAASPWNPNGTSWVAPADGGPWRDDLEERDVWQARHGGYQVHHNSLVFAGTWTKTFTRMTTMEAACESARHAVNAILDHYIWVERAARTTARGPTLDWRLPFGFLDQGFSSPVRHAHPGRRLLLRVRYREPGAARGPAAAQPRLAVLPGRAPAPPGRPARAGAAPPFRPSPEARR